MSFAIKVSKPGKDALTGAADDMVLSSEINTLKTYGSQTIEPLGTPITHNLGYIPMHLYAGYLSTKPNKIGLIGQNTPDNSTYVVAGTSTITNDNSDTWAASALVYVFYDSL